MKKRPTSKRKAVDEDIVHAYRNIREPCLVQNHLLVIQNNMK